MLNRLRLWALIFFLVFFLPIVALAQEATDQIVITDPTGGLLTHIPGGIFIYGILVMVAGLVSVFVADTKMPSFLAKIINFLAMNGGKAKNDPSVN